MRLSVPLFIFTLWFILFLPSYTYADESAQSLGTITVTPKRIPSEESRTAENVIVYTQKDIKKLPVRDLGEVLSYMPGVDVQSNGQFGQSSALSINGSNSRQVLLMVDGIPFNTQLSGQADPTKIPIEHIKQIEVIKGASSSAWGSSLGGVINVITQDTGDSFKPRGSFTTSYAEFATTKNSLDLAGKVADVGYLLTGSYFNTDGILQVTDTEESKGFGKLSYALDGAGEVTGSFGYSGSNSQYGITRSNTINVQQYNSRYGKLSFDRAEGDVPFNVSYKYNDQDIVTDILSGTTRATTSSTASRDLYHGLSLQGHTEPLGTHQLVMGVDFDWHTIKSNKYLTSSKGVNMQAPYANYTLPVGNWDFIPGLRYDHNGYFGQQTSPSLGTVYNFDDSRQSKFRAKVSRAFNAPPLLWIYNEDITQMVGANPDLKAERAMVYEAGFETKLTRLMDWELNLYRADVKDGIALVFDSVHSVFVQRNFRKFRRQGVDSFLKYKAMDHLTLYGGGGFNDVENRETGKIVRDQGVARQKFTFGAHYKNQAGLGINLSGYYNRWSSAPSLQANDRKPIFDLKLTQAFEDVRQGLDMEVFLSIHNLTNSKYWSSITYPLAERYFEGGFSLKF